MSSTDDLVFAREAVKAGMLDQGQADTCCNLVKTSCEGGNPTVAPEMLVKMKMLSPEQVRSVLKATGQRLAQCSSCGVRFFAAAGGQGAANCPQCGSESKIVTESKGQDAGDGRSLLGRTIGEYDFIELAGSGGMSEVYKVRNSNLDRIAAVKIFTREFVSTGTRQLKRFRREGKAAARLTHPNVIVVHRIGELEGRPFLEMEYVDGQSLGALIQANGAIEPEEGIRIFRDVCEALACAHKAGVIHRDIKPENILIAKDGSVKVTDFGLAKMNDESVAITGVGKTVGTPYYIAPEMIGGYDADERSDLYSLGVAMYEAFTGERPFHAKTQMDLLIAHKEREPRDPLEINPSVPEDVVAIVLRLMRKDPKERFQSALELLDALHSASKMTPLLFARFQGGGRCSLVPLSNQPITVGRSRKSTLTVDDPKMSRQHAAFVRRDDTASIRDFESRNGTWVNEKKVATQDLSPGDLVRIGGTLFLYLGPAQASIKPTGEISGAVLVASGEGGDAQRWDLCGGPVVIGKHSTTTVRLELEGVREFHAHLCHTGEGWMVTDLTGEGATLLNGSPIDRETLSNGDMISLAGFTLSFRDSAAAPAAVEAEAAEPEDAPAKESPDHPDWLDDVDKAEVLDRSPVTSPGEAPIDAQEDGGGGTEVRTPKLPLNGARDDEGNIIPVGDVLAEEADRVDKIYGETGNYKPQKRQPGQHVLVCVEGPLKSMSWPIGEKPIVFGRDEKADIRVDDEKVSRRHAMIGTHEGNVIVKDMGSRNGTRINKIRIQQNQLRESDFLRIGPCVFKLA